MNDFMLHPQLEKDTLLVCDLPLSQVRLMNDARFPWLVMIPRREGLTELVDLSLEDEAQLWKEVRQVCEVLQTVFAADKLNVAALGNQVPQLHLHVIARYREDAAWPNPIWGSGPMQPYDAGNLELRLKTLAQALAQ